MRPTPQGSRCLLRLVVVNLLFTFIPRVVHFSQGLTRQQTTFENSFFTAKAIPPKPSYIVFAGKTIQPGEAYKVAVTLFRNSNKRTSTFPFGPYDNLPATIQVQISRKGSIIISEFRECHFGSTELITVTIPDHFYDDGNEVDYSLEVEGNIYGGQHGSLFLHQRPLTLLEPDVRIVLESEHPAYRQGQTMRFRAVPLLASGRRFLDPIDIFLHDPSGIEMARWTARNAVSGPIHVSYHLASETPVGKWRLSASSRSSRPASHLSLPVVKYEPIGFEVRIWMPASVIPMDNGLRGWIEAKRLGDGVPIFGQLTLTAKLKDDKGEVLCEGPIYLSAASGIDKTAKLSFEYGSTDNAPMLGKLKWLIPQDELYGMCSEHLSGNDEKEAVQLELEAGVTNAENGQLVRAFSSTILHKRNIRMDFSLPSPAVIHPDMPFMAWVWAQRADGHEFSLAQLESLTMKLSALVEFQDGSIETIPAMQLFRKRKPQKRKHLWKVAFSLPTEMKLRQKDLKQVKLKAELENLDNRELLLFPPKTDPEGPQLQITTSTKRPMLGNRIILHVRSNFALDDFHCVITSKNKLLTTRIISMGFTKLKTFDEIVTPEMAPQATFLVWHVDNWGRMITASVTVPIFAHNGGHLDAHPVLEGQSGYTQVSITGEPRSLVMLKAINEDLKNRLLFHDDNSGYYEDGQIVSHSNLAATSLLVMTDSLKSITDESKLSCKQRGLFQCPSRQKCYDFLDICDGHCLCHDCSDEADCGGQSGLEGQIQPQASPFLLEQASNDFWRVLQVPKNGTLTLKVPFNTQGRLYLTANSLGTRGVASLGTRIVNVGTNIRFQMELPAKARLGETLTLRLSAINEGNIQVRRTFGLYSPSLRSFTFLSANGLAMDISSKLITITVPPLSHTVINVPIKPLDVGQLLIRARPTSGGGTTSESQGFLSAITHITHEGYEISKSTVLMVDLTTRPYFVDNLRVPIPLGYNGTNVLTLTEGIIGPIVPSIPFNISGILGHPEVTADEAIFVIGSLLHYRRNPISQMNSDQALKNTLSLAYQRLLSHQSPKGAFSFCQDIPSTFLTASALDVLQRLHSFYNWPLVDGLVIGKTLNWLVSQQSPDGSFREKIVFDGLYQRKIPIEFQEIALTSHVLISISGLDTSFNVTRILSQSTDFLKSRLEILDKSGTSLDIALVARALQVTKSDGAEAAFEILAKNRHENGSMSFWGHEDECDESLSVRSTALALMVYVDRGEFLTEAIVKWLNSKRLSSSGWGSTVDTLLATEALSLWATKHGQEFNNIEGGVAIEVDTQQGRRNIVVAEAKAFEDELNNVISLSDPTRNIGVEAKGRGLALVQLTSKFYTTSQSLISTENRVKAFNLEPRIEFKTSHNNVMELLVLSCQRWNCQRDLTVAGPAVLTLQIPTGYMIDSTEIERIKSNGYNAWTQSGNVIVFFHRLTPDYECVNFTLRRYLPVARLSPYVPVELRDWYSPERKNTTMVFLPAMNAVSVCEVCGSSDCPNCNMDTSSVETFMLSDASVGKTSTTSIIIVLLTLIFTI